MTETSEPRSRTPAGLPWIAILIGCLLPGLSACRGFDPLESLFDAFRDPTPAEAAAMAVDRYDPDNRRRGLSLLAAAPFGGEEVYVRLYREAATDPDPTVRAVAVMALGLHGGPEDAPRIIANLTHPDRLVRWEAANSLQRIHNPEAVIPLIDALRDELPEVRQSAARALGQYARPVVLDALINALDDANFGVVDAAHGSLRLLTGQDLSNDPRQWVAWRQRTPAGEFFANQQPFLWQPFNRPPLWWQRVVPLNRQPAREAEKPAGVEENHPNSPG